MRTVSVSTFLKKSSYWSKQAGVRWQLIIAMAVLWFAGFWLRNEYGQDDSNLWLVMNQFIRLAQWTIIILFLFSMITAVLTWLYFLQATRNKTISVQAKFGDGQKAEAGWVPFTVMIQGFVLRPLLGTVQASLVFAGKTLSEPVILDVNIPKPRHFWRQAIRGTGQTLLHDRGIYDVENVMVSFCDMLGLVSLPCEVPFNRQLFTLPIQQDVKQVRAQPNAVEEQKHRIEIPRRVEGEYVNYKEFESGDNIRRIVWKIYAKSGQLVVRIPETKDPYASHLYFYASFFHGFDLKNGAFEQELLNVYKDRVRNLLEALQRNGYDVRMPQDQEVPKLAGMDQKKNELFQITAANWQNNSSPVTFVNANKAAFVCMSSLTPISEVEVVLRNLNASIPVVVVKLSDAIPSPFQIRLSDIFFRPEKKPTDSLRQPWLLSSLRRTLMKNEDDIEALLSTRENSWMASSIQLKNESV
jgi:hypothetical protein